MPLWFLLVCLLFVFRDFPRRVPSLPLAAISPVDGKIGSLGLVRDPFLQRESLRVRLRQSRWGEFNVHSPIEGQIMKMWTPSRAQGGPPQNRYLAIHIRTDEGDDVVIALDVTSRFSYHRCHVHSGERVGQGRRCGFAGFGRRLDVFMPPRSHLSVEQGQPVRAGRDVLASFVHTESRNGRVDSPA